MTTNVIITSIVCLAAAIALVFAEQCNWQAGRVLFKLTASSAFVFLALQSGAATTNYGRLLLAALILSWIGDAFLLSIRNNYFLAGIAAFLFAHFAFAAAFASLQIDSAAFLIGMAIMSAVGAALLLWLWSSLTGFFKLAVPVYVAALVIMTAMAIAAGSASGSMLIPAGALAFAASDVAVARDRFVSHDIMNRAWGLPLYYLAQVLLAISAAPSMH